MDHIKEEMKNDSDEGGADRPVRMTPALNSLDRFLFVTDLVLKYPHDYNVNVSAWHNVKMETLPVHTKRWSVSTRTVLTCGRRYFCYSILPAVRFASRQRIFFFFALCGKLKREDNNKLGRRVSYCSSCTVAVERLWTPYT